MHSFLQPHFTDEIIEAQNNLLTCPYHTVNFNMGHLSVFGLSPIFSLTYFSTMWHGQGLQSSLGPCFSNANLGEGHH